MKYAGTIRETFNVLSTSGDEFLCVCPWHRDRSGHLYVNAAKGLYYCQVCGAKGHLERDLDLRKPLIGIDDVRETLARLQVRGQHKQHYYPESWLRQFDNPHPYWCEVRGLDPQVVARFRLGYDPLTNRVTIPLRDIRGRILGVTYRRLDDGKPKYLHPPKFPVGRHLYGAWALDLRYTVKTVALVEGQVDALRGWCYEVPTLGLMGARITRDQIKVLQRANVRTAVLMLDNDMAGIRGTVQISEMLKGSGIRVLAGWYRDYWNNVHDPDSLTRQRFRKMYHAALPITQWAEHINA